MMEPEAERVYESLTTDQLLDMHESLEQDLAHGAESEFCAGRLALIARILATRDISSAGM